MQFQCNLCLAPIQDIKEEYLGRKLKCPHCRQKIVLPQSPFGEGRIIGDFIIGTQLGEGSIGTVYLAKQRSLDRNVALKVLSAKYTTVKGVSSFLSEARIAAKLNHPNIVQVFAVGEDEGICYMAMNYIQGKTVREKIDDREKIPVDESLHIIQQVAEALHFAWEEGKLIHRDIKPENIILTPEGAVKLTDLGLAIQASETQKGMEVSGTPYFMSPEQFAGEKLDTRSDIYSLGITLYQMLTGHLPYDGKTLNTVAKKHFYEEPESLKARNPEIPDEVEQLVAKMIAKHPDDRFQNMDDLLNKIWLIRQNTAPNRDMIPGVHTISIRKLDYKLLEPPKPTHRTGKPPPAVKPKPIILPHEEGDDSFKIGWKFIGSLIVIVIIVAFIMLISHAEKTKRIKALENELSLIEKQFYGNETLNMRIEDDCQLLMAKIRNPSDPDEKNISLRIKLILAELKNRNNQIETKNLAAEIENMKKAIEKKPQENTQQREIAKLEVLKTIEVEKLKTEHEKEKQQVEQKAQVMEKELEQTKKTIEDMKKKEEEFKHNLFYTKFYYLVRQTKFEELAAILTDSSQKGVLDDKKAKVLKDRISQLQTIWGYLSKSGTKFFNVETPDGSVVKIFDGLVEFSSEGGGSISRKWSTLPMETLYSIVAKEFPDSSASSVKSDISLLIGKPGDAMKYQPDDEDLRMMIDSYFNSSLESVKTLAAKSRKKALQKYTAIQKEFGEIPRYQDQLDQLKTALDKNAFAESDEAE